MSDTFFTRQLTVPEAAESEREAVRPPDTVNALAELIADLLEPTGLVPADRLAVLRRRLGTTETFAQMLRDEGLASDEGVARVLAQRHHLRFVDIGAEPVAPEAVEAIPFAVLKRVEALPYRLP